MDVLGKLVELLTEFYGCDPTYYGVDALAIAQHLTANGVTVQEQKRPCSLCEYGGKHLDSPPCTKCPAHPKEQSNANQRNSNALEWISATERLPEKSGLYITFGCTAVPVMWLHNFDKDIGKFGAWWNYEPNGKEHLRYRFIEAENITHWMPIPQHPKGE